MIYRTNDTSVMPRQPIGERGVSLLEMLIVCAMLVVILTFGLLKIADAQRALQLTNSANEFAAFLEKARADSIRRHADVPAQMASVTITSATTYTVSYDANLDGVADSRTITLPQQSGISFGLTSFPLVVRFNWRGSTVDTSGNLVSIASFNLIDSDNRTSGPINVSASGDTSVSATLTPTRPNVSTVSTTANIRPKTNVP